MSLGLYLEFYFKGCCLLHVFIHKKDHMRDGGNDVDRVNICIPINIISVVSIEYIG